MSPGDPGALRRFLELAPKAEVHIHLEGAVSPAFLERTAERHRLAWAGRAAAELEDRARFGSFEEFLRLFRWLLEEHFRTPEDYVGALRETASALAAANVRYAELSISAGALLYFARPVGEIMAALTEAAGEIERAGGPELRFVADGVRQHGPEPLAALLEHVLPLPRERWPALGLAGAEDSIAAAAFAEVFRAARRDGLRADVHAGEAAGPESVLGALEHLRADRLIHAVSAARDPLLLQRLRAERIPLALNPTSNVRTGAVASLADHPVRRFLRAGMPVSINTDDPALLGTTLAGELEAVARTFHLGQSALEQLLLGGLECAFLPERRRSEMLQSWGAELERLRVGLGLDERLAGSPPRRYV